jgi:transcriptional regulator with XRE-family HTH domain
VIPVPINSDTVFLKSMSIPALLHTYSLGASTNVVKKNNTVVLMEYEWRNAKNLSGRLKWARESLNLSQAELASLAKVSQSHIASLETGNRGSSRKITSIAGCLKVDTAWLVDGKGAPRSIVREDSGINSKVASQISELILLFSEATPFERELIVDFASSHSAGRARVTKLLNQT